MKNKGLTVLSIYLVAFLSVYFTSQISILKNRIESADIGQLENQISELNEKVESHDSKISDLEDEQSDLDSRVDILEIYGR